jgi:site-specific DNA-methyltransferase (adenine-specific)
MDYGDSGGASRFFPVFRYQAKASRSEREAGLREAEVRTGMGGKMPVDDNGKVRDRFSKVAANTHPTVKPIALMEWLVTLVTPPGGVVLDPFMGSGTTGVAAVRKGFRFVGIEREDEYLAIARARIEAAS